MNEEYHFPIKIRHKKFLGCQPETHLGYPISEYDVIGEGELWRLWEIVLIISGSIGEGIDV